MTKAKADECFKSSMDHIGKGSSYGVVSMMNEFYSDLWEGWEDV